MVKSGIGTNEFFDINKFPKGYGLIVMPISMSRIATGQSAEQCINWILDFGINKVIEPKIGLNFIYTDFLYFSSEEKASVLKKLFMSEVIKHKNGLQKLVSKNNQQLQIQQAFTFQNWNELYISTRDFNGDLIRIKKLFQNDDTFKKYLEEDILFYKRNKSDDQIDFFLEEHLVAYLLMYQQIRLRNEYILGREEWVLWMYPGVPSKGLVYLFQKNPFKLQTKNPYLGQYNLTNNKFYSFNNIDLEAWDYE
jgi:hypothetical protein